MAEENSDIVIIGAGPGGYVAAIRAAQLGMKTAVVEREHLGGICLNWGCIPTKALLRSAEVYRLMNHANEYGLSAGQISFDLEKIVMRSRDVSQKLTNGIKGLMKKNKITVLEGAGKLLGKGWVSVEKGGSVSAVQAKHIIIATGARARVLPGLEPDGKQVWTYREAMLPGVMPKKLAVVGSGAIGSEFASFYNAFGAEVTLIEVMDRILPVEDEEISKLAQKQFERQGIKVLTQTSASVKSKDKSGVTLELSNRDGKKSELKVEYVIAAVGITGNTENLGLENTKVKQEKNQIITDKWMQTDEPGVYAIGDVAGAPWLAHKASHEGVICVEKIAGVKGVHALDKSAIPGCTYCHPQIASVGLTERAAKEKGLNIKVGRFPYIGNGKAIALGEPEGLVKTIFDATSGELLGAHMIGAEVTELIQGFVLGKVLEATELDFMHTVFPHPTLSEMMHESALEAFGKAIHI